MNDQTEERNKYNKKDSMGTYYDFVINKSAIWHNIALKCTAEYIITSFAECVEINCNTLLYGAYYTLSKMTIIYRHCCVHESASLIRKNGW